jgi:hypothetical protein
VGVRVVRTASLVLTIFVGTMIATPPALADTVKLIPFRSEITFDFQNDRAPQVRFLRLDTSGPTTATPTAVILGDFTSITGPYVIPAKDVQVAVRPHPESQTLELVVKSAPSLSAWKAGEFTSSIRVVGQSTESLTIPISLTFRSGSPVWGPVMALVLLALGLAIGLLFKANESRISLRPDSAVSKARKRVIRWTPIVTGFATAAVIVVVGFNSQYLRTDTFGTGGFSDWLALFGWGFAAGFSGKAISEYTATKATS